MRTTKEIKADIDAVYAEKRKLDDKILELKKEYGASASKEFEKEKGIKRGDILDLGRLGVICYDHINDWNGFDWISVRKIKKDGTPFASITTMWKSHFDNFKVVGHVDLPD